MGPIGTCRINRLAGDLRNVCDCLPPGRLGKGARLNALNHRKMLTTSHNIFRQVSVRLRNCSESVSSIAVLGF